MLPISHSGHTKTVLCVLIHSYASTFLQKCNHTKYRVLYFALFWSNNISCKPSHDSTSKQMSFHKITAYFMTIL